MPPATWLPEDVAGEAGPEQRERAGAVNFAGVAVYLLSRGVACRGPHRGPSTGT